MSWSVLLLEATGVADGVLAAGGVMVPIGAVMVRSFH
jgi:hypothetical protein